MHYESSLPTNAGNVPRAPTGSMRVESRRGAVSHARSVSPPRVSRAARGVNDDSDDE